VLRPKALLATRFTDIVQVTKMDTGGHFAAWEEPQALANDLRQFVASVRAREAKEAFNEKAEL